jgi:hypothetical protein
MPRRVVKTTGMKARPNEAHPARCLPSFSDARASKRVAAESAAAEAWDGRVGQETVASRATVKGWRWRVVITTSTFVPFVEEEHKRVEVVTSALRRSRAAEAMRRQRASWRR